MDSLDTVAMYTTQWYTYRMGSGRGQNQFLEFVYLDLFERTADGIMKKIRTLAAELKKEE